MRDKLISTWYKEEPTLLGRLLYPLSLLFRTLIACRRLIYRLLPKQTFPLRIIVVGNITVGGTGKTPMVIYLVELLKQRGYRPGVVSRGHGGSAKEATIVTVDGDADVVGDEPLLIAKRTYAPVVVAKKRVQAVRKLLNDFDCNVVISDDGLQHYAMSRDVEIVMMDGKRRLGNMHCLPAGPLRESVERLKSVDAIVVTEGEAFNDEFLMALEPNTSLVSLHDRSAILPIDRLKGQSVHAVAGIANPQRFFDTLEKLGISFEKHVFPDHYQYSKKDLMFADNQLIIMTEKDAVKCHSFDVQQAYYLPVKARLSSIFDEFVLKSIK